MKIQLLYIKSSRESWFEAAAELYHKKINGFVNFEIKTLKAKSLGRESLKKKKALEGELILNNLDASDYVILFDEKGKTFKSSEDFAGKLQKVKESGKSKLVFAIGGAYGASEGLKERANELWSLSDLTMNHMLATTVALEQIYRGLTIEKGIPYHNV